MNRRLLSLLFCLLSVLSIRAQAGMTASVTDSLGFPRPRAYRAVWFTTLGGLDWPVAPATNKASRERQQASLRAQFDRLQAAGINTILFQTRLRGTVAYRSALEPFDYVFGGKSGADPGYDPLAYAVEEAHQRGMEIHAWVVAFPVCRLSDMKSLGTKALPRKHPELCYKSTELYIMDPGQPGTAKYLSDLCTEIVSRYDVDGLHLDYIRYPETAVRFDDSSTYRRYGQGRPLKQWRRENVSRVVRTIAEAVRAVRPDIRMSCSPVGKYDDVARFSSKGWNAYTAVCQDPVEWVREGWMDELFPMMYFDGDNFYPFMFDWAERVGAKQVAPGLGLYQLHPREGNRQLGVYVRQTSVIDQFHLGGFALFRTRFLLDDIKGCYSYFRRTYGNSPILPPSMSSHPLKEPLPQPEAKVERLDWSLQFSWRKAYASDGSPLRVNIYRLGEGEPLLVASRIEDSSYKLTPALPALLHSRYALTFYDCYGHESEPVVVGL